ncbi:MAG: DUF1992 domain-containing protein [Acidobacteria bacterium]|nr:DUF1992 domain-containing protein [Acidobacteriota bacterium]
MSYEKIIEEKIKEAIENGEFDNLPGKGSPIDLDAYFATPADVRLGYSVLKSAKCLPEEMQLLKDVEDLKEKLAHCTDEEEQGRLREEIDAKMLKHHLLVDSNRRRSRGMPWS